LFRDKDDKAKEYQDKMEEVSRQHDRNVRMIDLNNQSEKARLDTEILELTDRISAMTRETAATRTDVENDAWR